MNRQYQALGRRYAEEMAWRQVLWAYDRLSSCPLGATLKRKQLQYCVQLRVRGWWKYAKDWRKG